MLLLPKLMHPVLRLFQAGADRHEPVALARAVHGQGVLLQHDAVLVRAAHLSESAAGQHLVRWPAWPAWQSIASWSLPCLVCLVSASLTLTCCRAEVEDTVKVASRDLVLAAALLTTALVVSPVIVLLVCHSTKTVQVHCPA